MKHIMKPQFKKFLCIFCASVALSGCSYFQKPEAPPAEPVVEAKPLPPPVNLSEIIARKTNGRVIMYSLGEPVGAVPEAAREDGAVEVAPLRAVPTPGMAAQDGGFAVPSDPAVRVFPLR
jgi:hypothetical protein